jgi:hypothetical protein
MTIIAIGVVIAASSNSIPRVSFINLIILLEENGSASFWNIPEGDIAGRPLI